MHVSFTVTIYENYAFVFILLKFYLKFNKHPRGTTNNFCLNRSFRSWKTHMYTGLSDIMIIPTSYFIWHLNLRSLNRIHTYTNHCPSHKRLLYKWSNLFKTTALREYILLRILLRNTPSSKNNSPPRNFKRHIYRILTNIRANLSTDKSI